MALPDVDHDREQREANVNGPYTCGMWDDRKDADICGEPASTAYVVHVFPDGLTGEVQVRSVLVLCDRHRDALPTAATA